MVLTWLLLYGQVRLIKLRDWDNFFNILALVSTLSKFLLRRCHFEQYCALAVPAIVVAGLVSSAVHFPGHCWFDEAINATRIA